MKIDQLTIIGVEDGSFKPFITGSKTLLCCTVFKGNILRDVRLDWISVDGLDATEKLLNMLKPLVGDILILGGISFAGFNIIDAEQVYNTLEYPVIIYSGKKPDKKKVKEALILHFNDWKKRWSIIEKLGDIYSTVTKNGDPPIYYETIGLEPFYVEEILRYSADLCRIPEPVRAASIIAKGLTLAP